MPVACQPGVREAQHRGDALRFARQLDRRRATAHRVLVGASAPQAADTARDAPGPVSASSAHSSTPPSR